MLRWRRNSFCWSVVVFLANWVSIQRRPREPPVRLARGFAVQPHCSRHSLPSHVSKCIQLQATIYLLYVTPRTTMVCAKCQKLAKSTTLATPGVKKKNDMYYGSPAGSGSRSKSGEAGKTSATLGQNGIGKVSATGFWMLDA